MSTFKNGLKLILGTILALALVGCKKEADSNAQIVNLSIWGNYLSPGLVSKFEKQTGIKVNISSYTSNEELLAKVQAGAAGIDVAVPSDYMVTIMTKMDLLHPIDLAQIPNSQNVLPEVLKQPFDPENKYSLPYAWSTAGIAVNRDLFKGEIKSWKDVFTNPALAGRMSMLDDVREVLAAALKYNGYSVNSTDEKQLKMAEETLIKLKSKVKMFRSDVVDSLVKKEVAVAQAYSTDAMQASAQANGSIEYILPAEGGTKAIDNLVILKNSPHLENAHKLINFMLSEEVNVEFVKAMWGGPVLKTTKEKLPANYQTYRGLFPSAEDLVKFEAITDLGESTRAYDEIWTRVKTN